MAKSVSVVPILDNSSSMTTNGYNFDTTIYSKYFVNLLRKSDNFAVVKFDYEGEILFPWSNHLVEVDQGKSQTAAAAKEIQKDMTYDQSGFATNISDGLQKAKALLDPDSSGNNRACVLLSDGWANTGGDPLSNLPGYPVMTIGMGQESDIDKLEAIATESDGEYFAVTASGDLRKVYTKITTLSAMAVLIKNDYTNVDVNDTTDVPLIIPTTEGLVQIAAVWGDPSVQYTSGNLGNNQVRVTMFDPNYNNPGFQPKVIDSGYVIFEEAGLQPGEWTMEYEFATSGNNALTSLSACVHYPSSNNGQSLKVALAAPQRVALGQPLTLSISAIENGVPVTQLQAKAVVSRPTISVQNALEKYAAELRSVQPHAADLARGMPEPRARLSALRAKLLKEQNLDILAYSHSAVQFSVSGDGLTATIPDVMQAGAYNIDVQIIGKSPIEGSFQRAEMATIVVYDPAAS
ncbi:VWA domain-containing protein (plasmid) [Rhizobium leguminosarum]|uniref:vWA domain-containing protein n=1 Tax=Rhizobium leguminosarum TaxID=384 RepID=UPI001A9324DC|nr:vWA domain-containing protein [Rhizobium leguminosarum]MBY5558824.1 VWA domain-containing protein [Rhizobium leguminosarum]QSW27726.1 VWA domain-containing protein [Rhizobium leguminosarum]